MKDNIFDGRMTDIAENEILEGQDSSFFIDEGIIHKRILEIK